MVAFPTMDREDFMAHKTNILNDETVTIKALLFGGNWVGNIVNFKQAGEQQVGSWLGKEF